MDNEGMKEIIKNTFGNIVLFPPVKEGVIPFELKDKFPIKNNSISFSAVISIQQKEYVNQNAYLKLIKYDEKTKKYNTFLLGTISLSDNKTDTNLVSSSMEIIPEESLGDGFPKRNNITFYFEDVPVLGIGKYAIALVIGGDDVFAPIASYYFDVVD